jgi:hypothetical protein
MAKKWAYLVTLWGLSEPRGDVRIGEFEALGISPYNLLPPPYAETMKSEDFDQVANPQAIGDFIRWIRDYNTLTVKKLRDPSTDIVREVMQNHQVFDVVSLTVAPLSRVSPEFTGKARLRAIDLAQTEFVPMKTVTPTNLWTSVHSVAKSSGSGSVTTTYDFVTFEAKGIKFVF